MTSSQCKKNYWKFILNWKQTAWIKEKHHWKQITNQKKNIFPSSISINNIDAVCRDLILQSQYFSLLFTWMTVFQLSITKHEIYKICILKRNAFKIKIENYQGSQNIFQEGEVWFFSSILKLSLLLIYLLMTWNPLTTYLSQWHHIMKTWSSPL